MIEAAIDPGRLFLWQSGGGASSVAGQLAMEDRLSLIRVASLKFWLSGLSILIVLAAGLLISYKLSGGASAAPQLHVAGSKLVNANGATVVLRGVDRSGTEYQCVSGKGIFDGPTNQASVTAMKQWGINAVRIPLNEGCWNGEPYVRPAYAGANYRNAIEAYVNLLKSNGIVTILDLHWTDGIYAQPNGCSSAKAFCQKPMPDLAGSVRFWSSVAAMFKGDDAVIFDLFNEPYPDQVIRASDAAWKCWLKGGSTCSPGITYPVAGMQTLVNTVRATGADNVIILGGLAHATDLSQWLKYEPVDPDHNLAAAWHSYSSGGCNTQSCWAYQLGSAAGAVPVIAGEIGESDCSGDYVDPLMAYLESRSIGYLAWAWNANFSCSNSLIINYAGRPTPYGQGYKSELEVLVRKERKAK